MKKVLAVLAVAVAMAACNNSGADASATPGAPSADSSVKSAADSVKVTTDSTSAKKDSVATDTTKKM